MQFEEIVNLLRNRFGELQNDEKASPGAILVKPELLINVCTELQENPALYFDMLSCVTGVDNGPEAGTMEVIYNLYSIPFDHHLMLKVVLPRESPEVETLSTHWKTANWHEREVYDLLGINFLGHPDLRRILLPADWEGHPLRKDYQHQEYYRGIRINE